MSLRREKLSTKKGRAAPNARRKPSMLYRFWRLAVEHPKGVLIAAATLLGLIVVLGNWRPTRAKLLVWEPQLPFIVWALIFMLVGYLTGKWIEWAIQQRRIRKGTYKPRVSAEDLADTTKDLEEKLPNAGEDEEDPATLIDRSGKVSRPQAASDGAVETVDYWDDGAGRGADRGPDRLGGRDLPQRGRPRSGEYAAAGDRSSGPAPSRYRGDREAGRYADYSDYSDGGRYSDYSDYQDTGSRRSAGRYEDYSDYQDTGGRHSGRRR